MPSLSSNERSSEDVWQVITIRKLNDEIKRRLRIRGGGTGRSMEEEARRYSVRQVVGEGKPPQILRRFDPRAVSHH